MADTYRAMTIGRMIRTAAARAPHKPALIHRDQTRTYGELAQRIAQAANVARSTFGLEPGDRIALVAPNCLDYVEIVAGFSEAGVIVATLNPRLTPAEFSQIAQDCTPRLLVLHPDCIALEDIARRMGIDVLPIGPEYDAALALVGDVPPQVDVAETDAFALAYTSGTTGQPKGVLLSHRSRAITFMAMAAEYGCFGQDDHFLAMAPMCHGAGFVFATATLAFGGTTTLFDWGDPAALIARLNQRDITGIFMVPTHFARLADQPEAVLETARNHALKAIISNAAALPQAMKEMAIRYFGDGLLHESYGSTEGGIVTNIRPADLMRKPGSVGLPFTNIEISLRTPDGDEAAPGQPGELFCRGPTGFNGYWQREADTAAAIRDGWVTVGDIATRDNDGFITIVDRKSDMVVTGGMNVYPREVELVIQQVDGIREAAVVGVPDREWGERLHAVIVPSTDAEPSVDAILDHCRRKLAGYKIPKSVSLQAELPRNAGGKLLKRALRESVIAETANHP
jgi:acyl-CoA synthetase (AMP-forming)/AMP-acid ligase II